MAKVPQFVQKKYDVARLLGITRPTLDKVLKEPDCPKPDLKKGYEILPLISFFRIYAERGTGSKVKNYGNDIGKTGETITELKVRELIAKVGKLEFALQKDMGLFILKSEWHSKLNALVQAAQSTFRRRFEQELPAELVGMNANEIRAELRKTYITVLNDLHAEASKI